MTHALDGIVVQLTVRCPYLFDMARFEGLTQRATQFLGIGRVDVHGFVGSLESEVRSREVVLAGEVDEGPPFGVREVYAYLALCCHHQVTHGLIVLWRQPAASILSGKHPTSQWRAKPCARLPRRGVSSQRRSTGRSSERTGFGLC